MDTNLFFDLLKKTKFHKGDLSGKRGKFKAQDFVSVNFRMPKTFRRVVEDDLRILEDNGMKISLNDYLLILIMMSANYGQKPEDGTFYHKHGMDIRKYFDTAKK